MASPSFAGMHELKQAGRLGGLIACHLLGNMWICDEKYANWAYKYTYVYSIHIYNIQTIIYNMHNIHDIHNIIHNIHNIQNIKYIIHVLLYYIMLNHIIL